MSNTGFRTNQQRKNERPKTQDKRQQRKQLSPSYLGTGMAARAGRAIQDRQKKLRELEGFADGGLIKGPGTGTSDDIEKRVPTGSYIMPADSTEQISPETLASLGEPTDVLVSNGEYELPPEQIYALGVQVLEQMKNSTHEPVGGFDPEAANKFADGGLVDDEDRRRRALQSPRQQQALPAPNQTSQNPYLRPSSGPSPQQQVDPRRFTQQQGPRTAPTGGQINFDTGRGYTLGDQVRANARADAAREGDSLRARQAEAQQRASAHSASQQAAYERSQQPKGPSRASQAVSRGRGIINAGGRFTPAIIAADAVAPSFDEDSTERYARRFGVSEPTGDGSFGDMARFTALRAGGFATDLANTLTFGQAGRLYQDKKQDSEQGESPYTEKLPLAGGVSGGVAGSKVGEYTGRALDAAGRIATRGRYSGNVAERALRPVGFLAGGGAGYSATDAIVDAYQNQGEQQQAPVDSLDQERPNQQPISPEEAPMAAQQEGGPIVQPRMVDGVPTFDRTNVTPEIEQQLSEAVNTIPSENFSQLDPSRSSQIGGALQEAANRGDWDAVNRYYANQGQSFGGQGFNPQRQQTTIIPDSGRQEAERRRLMQQLSRPMTGDPRRDMTRAQRDSLVNMYNEEQRRNLGFETAQMQDARASERNALDAQRLGLDTAAQLPQIAQAQRIERLYQALDGAETEEERSAITEQIRQLSNPSGDRRSPKDNYITVGGGQEWDEQSGTMRNVPTRIFDIENQQYITEAQNLPPIEQNPQAMRIFNDTRLSREQKAEQLRALGYN